MVTCLDPVSSSRVEKDLGSRLGLQVKSSATCQMFEYLDQLGKLHQEIDVGCLHAAISWGNSIDAAPRVLRTLGAYRLNRFWRNRPRIYTSTSSHRALYPQRSSGRPCDWCGEGRGIRTNLSAIPWCWSCSLMLYAFMATKPVMTQWMLAFTEVYHQVQLVRVEPHTK